MSDSTLIAYEGKITRQELALVPTPERTATHQTIPHHEVVNALIDTLGFRHIGVVRDEYAVDRTGAKMFGLMVLDQGMHGASFALGIRNSHDKSFRLSITVGYRLWSAHDNRYYAQQRFMQSIRTQPSFSTRLIRMSCT